MNSKWRRITAFGHSLWSVLPLPVTSAGGWKNVTSKSKRSTTFITMLQSYNNEFRVVAKRTRVRNFRNDRVSFERSLRNLGVKGSWSWFLIATASCPRSHSANWNFPPLRKDGKKRRSLDRSAVEQRCRLYETRRLHLATGHRHYTRRGEFVVARQPRTNFPSN